MTTNFYVAKLACNLELAQQPKRLLLSPKHVETPASKNEARKTLTLSLQVAIALQPSQKTKVDMLRCEVLLAREALNATEDKLKYETSVLQQKCAHEDTFKESNGDYHRPKYDVICRDCLKYLN